MVCLCAACRGAWACGVKPRGAAVLAPGASGAAGVAAAVGGRARGRGQPRVPGHPAAAVRAHSPSPSLLAIETSRHRIPRLPSPSLSVLRPLHTPNVYAPHPLSLPRVWLCSDQELHQLRLKRRGLANKKRAGAKGPSNGPNDADAATVDASKVRRPPGHKP